MAKDQDEIISDGMAALARRRWANTSDADKAAYAQMLAKSRKKISPRKRREIAKKAAAASAKVRSANTAKRK